MLDFIETTPNKQLAKIAVSSAGEAQRLLHLGDRGCAAAAESNVFAALRLMVNLPSVYGGASQSPYGE